MPLDKRCDTRAVGANIATMMGEGRAQRAAVAASLRTLKRACGVPTTTRAAPAAVVAAGRRGLARPVGSTVGGTVKTTTACEKVGKHKRKVTRVAAGSKRGGQIVKVGGRCDGSPAHRKTAKRRARR